MTDLSPTSDPTLFKLTRTDLPENTYIFVSEPSALIHFNPHLTTISGLRKHALKASQEFLQHLTTVKPELLDIPLSAFSEVVALSGGLYYKIADAFSKMFGSNLPQCFLGVKRRATEDGGWVADVSYKNLDSLREKPFLLMGDTIATGSTLEATFNLLKEKVDPSSVRGVALFSIAGALPGIQAFKAATKDFSDVYVFLSNALFGLSTNGTDMPWLHPETVAIPSVLERAQKIYGQWLAENWCTIWDWGDRANNPAQHHHELAAIIERDFGRAPTPEVREKLLYFREELNKEVDRFSKIRLSPQW